MSTPKSIDGQCGATTASVRLAEGVDVSKYQLWPAFLEMLDSVELFEYKRFAACVNDEFGTVDFDPFTGEQVLSTRGVLYPQIVI